MWDSGKQLGVNLYELEQVAQNYLPTGANVYGNAITKCQSGQSAQNTMSQVPEEFHGEDGPVSQAYGQLQGALVDVLQSTKTSLEETGDALHEAAALYADIDQDAKNKFDNMLDERGVPTPEVKS